MRLIQQPIKPDNMKPLNSKHYIITDTFNGSIPANIKEFNSFVGRARTLVAVITILLLVLGIAVNAFVCWVMIRSKKRTKSMSNLFVFHLSLTEIIPRIILSVLYVFLFGKRQETSSTPCRTILFAQYTVLTVLFGLLTGISIDRYYHIVHPLRCLVAKDRRPITLLLLWACAIVLAIPVLFTSITLIVSKEFRLEQNITHATGWASNKTSVRRLHHHPTALFQFRQCGVMSRYGKLYFTLYFTCVFCVPLVVMTVMYTKMLLFLWRRSAHNKMNKAVAKSKVKTVRLLLAVLLSFVFSWGPLMIAELCALYNINLSIGSLPLLLIARCISYTSSILNPLIYSIGNSSFRREARRVLHSSIRCRAVLSKPRKTLAHGNKTAPELCARTLETNV